MGERDQAAPKSPARAPDELLHLRLGKATVAENIARAVEAGWLTQDAAGTLRLAKYSEDGGWRVIANKPPPDCGFLMNFLFHHAYAGKAVPHGCGACYKVKAAPRTLRQLVAAVDIAKTIDCYSKWGIDFGNPYSQDLYAGYLYVESLADARAIYRALRDAFDQDAKIGPAIKMTIKRGCSKYEAKFGPLDDYRFRPELRELEAHLRPRFAPPVLRNSPLTAMAHWIDFAFHIGDDTYLDFTGGKRLRPKMRSYDP